MDYATAVNAEVLDLKAAGADVIQLDAQAASPRRGGVASGIAGDRQGTRRLPRADGATPLLGYAYVACDKPNVYAFLPESGAS